MRPLVGLLVAFGAIGMWWALNYYPGFDADWMSYHAALDRLLSGEPLYTGLQSEPYRLDHAAWGAGYVYPPSSVPMLFLAWWEWPWRILNLAVLLYGTWVATRSPLALALMVAFPPTWAVVANGNAMGIIVGVYGVAYGSQVRWLPVLAAAVKPFAASLLILAWRRGEPVRWPVMVVSGIALLALLGGYLPVVLNARPICEDNQILSFHCTSPPLAYSVTAFLGLGAVAARTDRLAFALLCLAPFAFAPDWTWAYWLLPMLAMSVLLAELVYPTLYAQNEVPSADARTVTPPASLDSRVSSM